MSIDKSTISEIGRSRFIALIAVAILAIISTLCVGVFVGLGYGVSDVPFAGGGSDTPEDSYSSPQIHMQNTQADQQPVGGQLQTTGIKSREILSVEGYGTYTLPQSVDSARDAVFDDPFADVWADVEGIGEPATVSEQGVAYRDSYVYLEVAATDPLPSTPNVNYDYEVYDYANNSYKIVETQTQRTPEAYTAQVRNFIKVPDTHPPGQPLKIGINGNGIDRTVIELELERDPIAGGEQANTPAGYSALTQYPTSVSGVNDDLLVYFGGYPGPSITDKCERDPGRFSECQSDSGDDDLVTDPGGASVEQIDEELGFDGIPEAPSDIADENEVDPASYVQSTGTYPLQTTDGLVNFDGPVDSLSDLQKFQALAIEPTSGETLFPPDKIDAYDPNMDPEELGEFKIEQFENTDPHILTEPPYVNSSGDLLYSTGYVLDVLGSGQPWYVNETNDIQPELIPERGQLVTVADTSLANVSAPELIENDVTEDIVSEFGPRLGQFPVKQRQVFNHTAYTSVRANRTVLADDGTLSFVLSEKENTSLGPMLHDYELVGSVPPQLNRDDPINITTKTEITSTKKTVQWERERELQTVASNITKEFVESSTTDVTGEIAVSDASGTQDVSYSFDTPSVTGSVDSVGCVSSSVGGENGTRSCTVTLTVTVDTVASTADQVSVTRTDEDIPEEFVRDDLFNTDSNATYDPLDGFSYDPSVGTNDPLLPYEYNPSGAGTRNIVRPGPDGSVTRHYSYKPEGTYSYTFSVTVTGNASANTIETDFSEETSGVISETKELLFYYAYWGDWEWNLLDESPSNISTTTTTSSEEYVVPSEQDPNPNQLAIQVAPDRYYSVIDLYSNRSADELSTPEFHFTDRFWASSIEFPPADIDRANVTDEEYRSEIAVLDLPTRSYGISRYLKYDISDTDGDRILTPSIEGSFFDTISPGNLSLNGDDFTFFDTRKVPLHLDTHVINTQDEPQMVYRAGRDSIDDIDQARVDAHTSVPGDASLPLFDTVNKSLVQGSFSSEYEGDGTEPGCRLTDGAHPEDSICTIYNFESLSGFGQVGSTRRVLSDEILTSVIPYELQRSGILTSEMNLRPVHGDILNIEAGAVTSSEIGVGQVQFDINVSGNEILVPTPMDDSERPLTRIPDPSQSGACYTGCNVPFGDNRHIHPLWSDQNKLNNDITEKLPSYHFWQRDNHLLDDPYIWQNVGADQSLPTVQDIVTIEDTPGPAETIRSVTNDTYTISDDQTIVVEGSVPRLSIRYNSDNETVVIGGERVSPGAVANGTVPDVLPPLKNEEVVVYGVDPDGPIEETFSDNGTVTIDASSFPRPSTISVTVPGSDVEQLVREFKNGNIEDGDDIAFTMRATAEKSIDPELSQVFGIEWSLGDGLTLSPAETTYIERLIATFIISLPVIMVYLWWRDFLDFNF